MKKFYSVGLAAFLVASPAMAQVVIGGGDNDAARHDRRAQEQRMDAHQDAMQAHRDAAMGNYGDAAREQREAHHEFGNARHQEHEADRDSNGGFRVQVGH